jgi:RNA polymerase sigma-70 factor, ECF subfamily
MTVAETDADIVRAVRKGDTQAFRTLVERHKGRLFSVVLRLVGDPGQAEEIAQETFVKAFRSLGDFRGESSFGTWLVQIGIYAARDQVRAARRRPTVSLDVVRGGADGPPLEIPDPSPAADPEAGLEAEERRRIMRRAIATLPPEYREVLVLKHLEGWAYAQIAVVTGASIGTLKVRCFRARELLRERLEELGWTGEDRLPLSSRPVEELSRG